MVKKKYALTHKFVAGLCSSNRNPDYILLVVKIISNLERISKRLKKESATRTSIEKLLNDIKNDI